MVSKINFEDLIIDYAIKKVGENISNINEMDVYKNKHYFQDVLSHLARRKCFAKVDLSQAE